jgi:hypothetical protein
MARNSPKMSLVLWDQLDDPYSNSQLAGNFTKIDYHDHSSGRGVPISTAGIANGAVGFAQTSFYLEGVYSAIPVPATAGRLYYATDTEVLWLDQVSSWINVTPTPWVSLVLTSGIIGSFPGGQTQTGVPAVRLDPGGVLRFRGELYNNSGSAITTTTSTSTLATIPTGEGVAYTINPPDVPFSSTVLNGSSGDFTLYLACSGLNVVLRPQQTLAYGKGVALDGWTLTDASGAWT